MNYRLLLLLVSFLPALQLHGSSFEPLTPDQRSEQAEFVVHGTVETVVAFRDEAGFIFTEATIRVTELVKGDLPERFILRYRGGETPEGGETIIGAPRLRPHEERIFFLTQDPDGALHLVGGPLGAPLIRTTAQRTPASAGPLATAEGVLTPAARSILPDRREPIRYLVDADALPSGISLPDAMQAVEKALNAWVEVSSVTFRFDGMASFGTAANLAGANDGCLRIQLHDTYGAIGGGSVLGIGGMMYRSLGAFPSGGAGGRVGELEFHVVTGSYVVLKHTATSLQNIDTFEAVLGHEIGHSLGLAHSSENPNEPNPELNEALMYYRAHGDGRGATLAPWDVAAINRVHPVDPPPYAFDRNIRAITGFDPFTNPEVNQVELRGYRLNGGPVVANLISATTNNGAFNLAGSVLTYETFGAYGDSDELAPDGLDGYYDRAYVRFSDGTHLSPPAEIRVIRLLLDQYPSGAPDGLPNSWMEEHFGSPAPVAGLSRATDDPDGDGLTNLQEFLLGTDPRDVNSRLAVTAFTQDELTWQARPFEVYEIQSSDDLENWHTYRAIQPETSTGVFNDLPLDAQRQFFRVKLVP